MIIRKFQEKDREYLRNISADTAMGSFAKNPKKREAIKLAYMDYYLDHEPQNVIVAENNGKAVGYIVCSLDAQKFQTEFPKYIKKMKKYSKILAFFQKICLKTSKKLDLIYSGGFHINIDKDNQGGGLGTILLTVMGQHILKNGKTHMYLITKNRKTRGYGFYKHFGFEEKKRYPLGSLLLVYDLKNLNSQHNLQNISKDIQINLD